jgi:tetrahydromethanopterin S-methyltransferase subunit G
MRESDDSTEGSID